MNITSNREFKHLGQIGVFVQQNYSQTNAPRVQAVIHSFIHIRLINIRNTA